MEPPADQLRRRAQEVASLRQKLVLAVGPPGSGKTAALRALRSRAGAQLVNVGLELSRRMLELTARQRKLRLAGLLEEVVADALAAGEPSASEPVPGWILLDNIEIVFEPSFEQDPLRLLQGLSRHRVVVAAWPGAVADGWLSYAEPGHPEHRRYLVADSMPESMAVSFAAHVPESTADPIPEPERPS